MRNKMGSFLFLACIFFTTGARCAGKDDPAGPEALISRARLQEDIWTDGTPPMLMRAEIQVSDAKGALVQGEYNFNWVSPTRWREEISIGNYERLRVREAKGYWQKTGLSYQPQVVFQLETLLQLTGALKVGSQQTLGKVKNREKDGVRQKCTEVKGTSATDRIMCFNEANGALVTIEYPIGDYQNPPEISSIEYGSFKAVGEKLVPYEMRALKDKKIFATVKVLEIAKVTEENSALFNAPADAQFWAQCDDMQEVELVNRVQPTYPTSARANHEHGRVVFYVVVEADGSLSHVTIIHRVTPNLESAAVEAIRHWHYKPAACGPTPIRVETSIALDFWVQLYGKLLISR